MTVPPPPQDLRRPGATEGLRLWRARTEVSVALPGWDAAFLGSVHRVSLVLDGVRGRRDAALVRVSLRPPGAPAGGDEDRFAGSLSLYGLRQSSLTGGLQLRLDLTPSLEQLLDAGRLSLDAVVVSLLLPHALPEGEALTVERLRVVAEGGEE